MKPKTTEVKQTKPLPPRKVKIVKGDGKDHIYMSPWYDWDNEENRL